MDNWLKPYIEKLQNIFEINEYDQFVTELYEILECVLKMLFARYMSQFMGDFV